MSTYMSDSDTVRLTDLEAAHLPDSYSIHSVSRPPTPTDGRPPSFPNEPSLCTENRPAPAVGSRPRSYPARLLSRLMSPVQSRPPSYPDRPLSSAENGLPQSRPASYPGRPPSYTEQGTEEPLPSYTDVLKKKAVAVQQYPGSKMPNKRARLCFVSAFALICIIILAVSIAVTRINHNDAPNSDANGTPVSQK